tara:strand:+ start:266 stop:760 length:495 start_codon:yes stop_codon:yes gene_type:complete
MSWDKPLASPLLKPGKCSVCDAPLPGNITSDLAGQRRTELAYIGGYLDGEGCFRAINTAIVSVANTYPYTLMGLQRLFGGTIRCSGRSNSKRRTCYEWFVCGEGARNCIKLVMPYLWEKREQAELLLEIYRYPAKSRRRKKLRRVLAALKRINYTEERLDRETR